MDEPKDFGLDENAIVRRWMLEIDCASKREKSWRESGEKIYKKYKGENKKRNSFNILWSNTETLMPALYNSTPKPDVRRRFKDVDPLGKAVAEVLQRAITYSVDCGNFDEKMEFDIVDSLLPGRATSQVLYVPTISTTGDTEAVTYEQTTTEHIHWEDLRIGPGKIWSEVPWIAIGSDLRKFDVKKQFGDDIADLVKYNIPSDEKVQSKENEDIRSLFDTARFWCVWDKDEKQVFFLTESVKKRIFALKNEKGEPPVNFKEFFPIPEPLRLFVDPTSNIPTILYDLYEEQAEELNIISSRINRIVEVLRVRGIYDSTLSEISQLLNSDNNDLIPITNAAKWADRGGIEKAIWYMPIDQCAIVLRELYAARDQCKQVIYEITGLSDIIRGSTDPNETLGAQQIKNQWGTLRLQRMQRRVQRYIRDLIRLMGEVIAEKFSIDTLAKMTGLKYPSAQEKAEAQVLLKQAQADSAQQQNPQIQQLQDVISKPSWEEILQVMRNDPAREFRIDIETDSTISATLNEDTVALKELLTGIVQFVDGITPAVQSGAVPMDTVKSLIGVICRRSKLGLEVEDAIDQIKQPAPQPDPEQAKAQAAQQAAQVKAQTDQQIAQMKTETDQAANQMKMQSEQMKIQMQAQLSAAEQKAQQETDMVRQQAETQQHQMKIEMDAHVNEVEQQFKDAQHQRDQDFLRWKAELEAAVKIEVANISAQAAKENAATKAAENEIATEVKQ